MRGKIESANKNYDLQKLLLLAFLTVIVITFFILWGLNQKNIGYFLPRRILKMSAILLVSYCIGYSTVTFQTITNNRILTPSIMGLDSLYLFIQTVIVFFFGSGQLAMMTGYTNFVLSVICMVGASWLLFYFLFRGENKNLYFLVLAGMIVGGLFNGMATFMQVLLDPNEFLVLQGKMFASFNQMNQDLFGISLIAVLIIFVFTLKDFKVLDVMALGKEQAVNLGVPYDRMVLKSLMIISVLIAISTALVGPITFLGIMVVSIGRSMIHSYTHRYKVTAAVLIGCFALAGGTLIVERIFRFSTALSVIINFIGGIYFIFLILKESRQ